MRTVLSCADKRIKLTYNEETHSIIHKSMGNIVGSYETKYWWGTWIPVKNSIVITPEQRAFFVGSLLGDGTMRIGEHAKNANHKIEHGLEQKEYVFWKYKLLKSLVFTEPRISYRYDSLKEKYPKSWWFRTIRHPLLTEIYDLFYERDGYRNGRKIVPKTIARELTPLGLAVWIMDDGSYSQRKIDISTYSFTLSEINLLCAVLKKNFEITFKFYKDRDKGYRMYCNQVETKKLIKVISPYFIDSMKYKLGFVTP